MVILRSSKAGTSFGVNNRDRVAPGVFIVVLVYCSTKDSEIQRWRYHSAIKSLYTVYNVFTV